MTRSPTVFVVDPDPTTAQAVTDLLQGRMLTVQWFASGLAFLSAYGGCRPSCLVLELQTPDISGFQIRQRLAERNHRPPTVYITSVLDVATAVALMRQGAVYVLEKPLPARELLGAIQEAIAIDRHELHNGAPDRLQESFARLTEKERELVSLVATARSTKSIASVLDICPRAVELRRRRVMEKLGLLSSLELLRYAVLARRD